ncbi:hypothetical protein ACIP5Y_39800 [Nocardia sp. NPDC088792]|uniref:hypothetical protein n=1 Tax=Nocardia sp. NPDC088792 TaxID=3364332 RepID=UPI0037F9D4E2
MILELVVAAALTVAVVVTEGARRRGDLAAESGLRRVLRPLWPLVIMWSLFWLLALQDTGIAPFLGYVPAGDLPDTRMCALLAMWAATLAFGAAAMVHTLVVAGSHLRVQSKHVVPVRYRKSTWALMIGVLIGIALAVPVCVLDWNNPAECIALSR